MTQSLYLEFKYIKNRSIDLGDGKQYVVPQRTTHVNNSQGHDVLITEFNMDKVFRVDLEDEIPQLPVRETGMSERYHEELCDEAFRKARQARERNDIIRSRIKQFIKSGTIEVTHDPFKRETEPDSDKAAAKQRKKPSEIAAEIDSTKK